MTSRLVTVDLILTVLLQLSEWQLLPITEEELQRCGKLREILVAWSKQIEAQRLGVSLDAIAENALQVFRHTEGEKSWERLISIGERVIERARELELLDPGRSAEVGEALIREEMAKALKQGKQFVSKRRRSILPG
jgi:hypothetical protein